MDNYEVLEVIHTSSVLTCSYFAKYLAYFPIELRGFNRRCHRIASFSRLVDSKIFCGIWLKMNRSVH